MNSHPEVNPATTDERAQYRYSDSRAANDQPADEQDVPDAVRGTIRREELEILARVIDGVRYVVLFVSLTVWSVLGFAFWIPMLVYTIIHFSACILYVTITEDDPRMLGVRLERAVRFYLQGFRNVIHAVYSRPRRGTPPGDLRMDVRIMVLHVLGTLVFWAALAAAVLYLAGAFEAS